MTRRLSPMDRRLFLASLAAVGACSQEDRPPTILLRSGWQTENIGDIAHTPGVLHLLEQHLPEVKVILWSNALENGVFAMLDRRFPDVEIVSGEPEELAETFDRADTTPACIMIQVAGLVHPDLLIELIPTAVIPHERFSMPAEATA